MPRGLQPRPTLSLWRLPIFFQCFIHKRSVEQSSGCANELNTFISFNETPQSSPKLCFVRWRIPLASPHNILNFTRVEHSYKPCRSTSVWPTSCRLLNKFILVGAAGFELATSCSQSKRSTKLNYAPIFIRLNYLEVRSFRPLTHLSLF